MTSNRSLHPYQQVAVDHLHRNPRAALFLDMGLGKTATVLRALTPDHLPVLVCAPKRVAEHVWPAEAALWRPDLSIAVAAGSPAHRAEVLRDFHNDIVVIGRDVLKDAVPVAGRFRTVVLDESSGFKTRGSLRWKTAKKIVKDTPYVWELTGTPSPNGLMDLWAPTYLLDAGARLAPTLTGFRGRYFRPGQQLPNGVITEWILREGAAEKIHAAIEDICLSMDGDGRIELPPVTFNTVTVPLTPATRKVYEVMRDTLVVALDLLGETHTAANAAVLSSKLSQISAGFMYVDDADLRDGAYDVLHREKVAALAEIVEGTGSPILVFYRFKAEREMIRAAMPKLVHTIDEPDAVGRWNAGEIPVLLAHPASAGHGLNLQAGGHTIVWTTCSWSLEEWLQGNGRLARQGQQHPVVIHSLVSPGTVDEAIQERLLEKKSVQQALLDHLASVL